MSKKLSVIWNVISALSVLYLLGLSIEYVIMFILEGAIDTFKNTYIEGGWAFFMVVSMIIVLYHVFSKIILIQLLRAREIMEEKADKAKKVAVKKQTANK